MINKQKLWFMTLFSIILVLSVYYVALPEASLNNLIASETSKSEIEKFESTSEDSLATLRIEDEEEMLNEISSLQETIQSVAANVEERNAAYEKMNGINNINAKEETLEKLILKDYNLKSFIKIKDDQITITIASKNASKTEANNIIRTIQSQFNEKQYIVVKYQ